jgi:hypothetical protein
MKKILLSLAALTAMAQAGGNIGDLTPLTEVIPEAKGSLLDKVSIGGYGKIDYQNFLDDDGKTNRFDNYRMILYVGYQFTDNIKYVSEIEWEHGGVDGTGESLIEQSYVDFKVNEALNFKVGHMIVPVGMVNLYHEPTAFNAVNRPEIEKNIIPSTWHENGVIAHGKYEGFSYQAGIMAGLKAEGGKNIRKMRQSGIKSDAEDFGFVARLDYNGFPGLNIGGSYFTGDAGQGNAALDDVTTSVGEVHAGFNYKGFNVRGLYAMSLIKNARKVALDGNTDVAAKGKGYYVNAAYNIGEWTPFVRYEAYNDKEKSYTATGIRNDKSDDIKITTLGLNYNPTENVVLKADYVIRDNRGTDDNRFELGIGWAF